jgi:DNA (cytosine-5)-methyltransferase 1
MTIGAVDLFCGIGGLTFGLQKAGLDVVAGIDNDIYCEYAFSGNNHSQFICRNIECIRGRDVATLLSGYDVRVLVGCAPCQPFSTHQKDKLHRSRHKNWSLLYHFARIVREVKPDIITMENVPELRNEMVFADLVDTLKAESYFVDYRVIRASDYGVPQRRRRLILLASRFGPIRLIDRTHEKEVTVRDVIEHLSPIAAGEKNHDDRLHVAPALSDKNSQRIRCSLPGGTWRDWPESLRLQCHKTKAGNTYRSVYGRMRWDALSPTITTQFTCFGTGRFGHPAQNRALTLREGALLQTFPETYSFVPDDKDVVVKIVSRQIGNAMPPRLGEVIGLSIIEHINLFCD